MIHFVLAGGAADDTIFVLDGLFLAGGNVSDRLTIALHANFILCTASKNGAWRAGAFGQRAVRLAAANSSPNAERRLNRTSSEGLRTAGA